MIQTLLLMVFLVSDPECAPIEKEINGKSLEGQLAPGQKVVAFRPDCMKPQRMDFAIFTSEESENLVIKQVWGMPGDMLTVTDRGRVLINGDQTLTPFDKPYILKPFFSKRLKKFEGALEGYLLLGHPGSLDSGRVGPIPLDEILAVVPKDEGRARKKN